MNKKGQIFCFFAMLAVNLAAQEARIDTVMQLNTVSVRAERYEAFSAGQKLNRLNAERISYEPGSDLGQALRKQSSVYIRSYGQSGVSSMSFRGTSSAQSGVFWNGINIRMPSLGSTDLSLVPAGLFNNASIVYGGNSIRYGSGTIGGAVFLNNVARFERYEEAGIGLSAGSFGSIGSQLSVSKATGRWYLKLDLINKAAENDFDYKDERDRNKKMNNARVDALGMNAHAAFRLGSANQMDVYLWYQEAIREIPPSLTMNTSEAYQSDRALRTSVQWKSFFRKGVLHLKSAWFSEYENYTDPLIGLSSEINTGSIFFEGEYRHQLGRNSKLNTGFSFTSEHADIEAYGENKDRQGLAVFANFRQTIPALNWILMAGARQEVNENILAPFTPSLGLEGSITAYLSHKISLSRNYRLPTMNELYWQPGGNPDIRPEESWNAEFSLIWNVFRNKKPVVLRITGTAFHSMVDNWILWQPVNIYWEAENIQKVWARGIESRLQARYSFSRLKLEMDASYTYSRSTNEANTGQEEIKGKQIIYTPLHNAAGNLAAAYNRWSVGLQCNYSGLSYLTSDNEEELPAALLFDLRLTKEFEFKAMKAGLSLAAKNLFDKDYQLVAYRPMPGRNFLLTLKLTYKN